MKGAPKHLKVGYDEYMKSISSEHGLITNIDVMK